MVSRGLKYAEVKFSNFSRAYSMLNFNNIETFQLLQSSNL
jgi:hypothetical protein